MKFLRQIDYQSDLQNFCTPHSREVEVLGLEKWTWETITTTF